MLNECQISKVYQIMDCLNSLRGKILHEAEFLEDCSKQKVKMKTFATCENIVVLPGSGCIGQ